VIQRVLITVAFAVQIGSTICARHEMTLTEGIVAMTLFVAVFLSWMRYCSKAAETTRRRRQATVQSKNFGLLNLEEYRVVRGQVRREAIR